MVDFSIWDIFRNLLLAARWTVAAVADRLRRRRPGRPRRCWSRGSPAGRGAEPLARGYVQLFQGTPLLMQLFLAYFGIALVRHQRLAVGRRVGGAHALHQRLPDRDLARLRGLGAEGPVGGVGGLALSLGEQLRHVIGPQALRVAVPPTVGFLVQVVKGTALASVIGFVELTKAGTMITNATFRPSSSTPAWR